MLLEKPKRKLAYYTDIQFTDFQNEHPPYPYGEMPDWAFCNLKDSYLVRSDGHRRLPNGRWSASESIEKSKFRVYSHEVVAYPSGWLYTPRGPLRDVLTIRELVNVQTYSSLYPELDFPDNDDDGVWASMISMGASLYRRARPGNPTANIGQFLIEARDLPRLPVFLHQRLKNFRDLGDEYLNMQFGWGPFVSDLVKMYRTAIRLDKQLSDIKAMNGKWLFRRRGDPDIISSVSESVESDVHDEESMSNRSAILHDWVKDSLGRDDVEVFDYFRSPYNVDSFVDDDGLHLSPALSYINRTRTEKKAVWFVGYFYYYIPEFDWKWTQKATAALFGLNPTPALLWEVLPWSWLIDWFSNVGDVLSNASENAVENQVAVNCMVSRHRTVTDTIVSRFTYPEWPEYSYHFGPFEKVECVSALRITREDKRRIQGSPYGFGITFDSLSVKQQAILAALGISRVRF